MWCILYIEHFTYLKEKKSHKFGQWKKYTKKQNVPILFTRFYNRPPERNNSVRTHTDIAVICICSHRSTSLVQRVLKGRWWWAVPELLPSMAGAGMSSWGSPKAKENTSSSSRMEKQSRQNYCGNNCIDQEWSWLKGAPRAAQVFSSFVTFFPLPSSSPSNPLSSPSYTTCPVYS